MLDLIGLHFPVACACLGLRGVLLLCWPRWWLETIIAADCSVITLNILEYEISQFHPILHRLRCGYQCMSLVFVTSLILGALPPPRERCQLCPCLDHIRRKPRCASWMQYLGNNWVNSLEDASPTVQLWPLDFLKEIICAKQEPVRAPVWHLCTLLSPE